jgi:hypothetical protein
VDFVGLVLAGDPAPDDSDAPSHVRFPPWSGSFESLISRGWLQPSRELARGKRNG